MRKIILFFLVIINMLPAVLHAQTRVISGTVRDAGGVLPGASVVEKGRNDNGTVTDANGKFTLTLKGSSNAVVANFVGYTPREVTIGSRLTGVDITMISNNQGLDEVVVVAYGKSSRITSTGAVNTISAADIRTVPTANVQNALSGRMPGFFSQQTSGQPGKDASDFYIRGISSLNPDGNKPLIIVDDIEYTYDQLQQINVNEIETISILKDASTTAIYGIKGANGVLVVTTRRGKNGKPQLNLRTEAGLQSPTRAPKFLNSYDAALLINQANANDGTNLSFSQADLNLFKNGTDPYGHPDVNWYDAIFNKFTYQANTNLDISGGTDQLRYFISGGALTQNGLAKTFADPRGKTNTQYDFQRYNFRSNLDLKANKTLDLRLDITTRFANINSPRISSAGALAEVYDFSRITPFTAPFLNPDGSYAYATSKFNPSQLPTLNARLATGGYDNTRRTDYNMLFNATQRLNEITDGLSVSGRVAFASTEQFTKSAGNYGAIPTYHYDPVTKTTIKNPNGSYVFPNIYYAGNYNIYTTNVNVQLFGNYDRTFGSKHHVTGLVLASQSAQTYSVKDDFPALSADRVAVPAKSRGLSLQGEYQYDGKYLFKINGAYNGTDRFAAKNRYGWFPSVSAGYNISKEEFFKNALPVFGLFKIRGSYGLVGSDAAPGNKYIYTQTYERGGGYNFGTSQYTIDTYREGSLSNFDVTWEKQREADIGLDINMLKDNSLSISIDFFRNIRYDQLIEPKNIPLLLGASLPAVNVGRTQNMGFDGQIGYRTTVGKVQVGTNFVFSYAKNKVLFQSEALPAYPRLAKTGQPIDQPFGYHYLGYYTPADIADIKVNGNKNIAIPDSNYPVQAGDLKYEDLNGDGIISVFDQKPIGHAPLATTNLGLNLTASYGGFNVSVLFQGSFNYSYIITGTGIEPFQSQFQPIHQQAWTPASANNAQFPRLTQFPTTVNSPKAYPSDYWLVNAYYIRLKTVDMGYQFPSRLLPFHLNNARIYLSAYNLFTWNNFNRYQQDPEVKTNTAGDAYINQRVVNLGIQLGF